LMPHRGSFRQLGRHQ